MHGIFCDSQSVSTIAISLKDLTIETRLAKSVCEIAVLASMAARVTKPPAESPSADLSQEDIRTATYEFTADNRSRRVK